jgi:mannose/fructose/N-acetylgalactosamine-specific phosphotransferase system component IID
MNGDVSMKIRIPSGFQHSHDSAALVAALCQHLDHIMPPVATACLTLGVVAVILQTSRMADYLMATGLLLHLGVWFADWLKAVRHK